MERILNSTSIKLMQGDITEMETDAIVNAANAMLLLGSGVAGAIHEKGGPQIQEECDRIGGTFVGGAVITSGGNLKAPYIIHAVGPRMGEGNEEEKLKNAIFNSLKLADKNNLKSIAFPAISTGVFGYPVKDAARVIIRSTVDYIQSKTNLKEIFFCLFDQETLAIFEKELNIAHNN